MRRPVYLKQTRPDAAGRFVKGHANLNGARTFASLRSAPKRNLIVCVSGFAVLYRNVQAVERVLQRDLAALLVVFRVSFGGACSGLAFFRRERLEDFTAWSFEFLAVVFKILGLRVYKPAVVVP